MFFFKSAKLIGILPISYNFESGEFSMSRPFLIYCFVICSVCTIILSQILPCYLQRSEWFMESSSSTDKFVFLFFISCLFLQRVLCYIITMLSFRKILVIFSRIDHSFINSILILRKTFWLLFCGSFINLVGNIVATKEDFFEFITLPQFQKPYLVLNNVAKISRPEVAVGVAYLVNGICDYAFLIFIAIFTYFVKFLQQKMSNFLEMLELGSQLVLFNVPAFSRKIKGGQFSLLSELHDIINFFNELHELVAPFSLVYTSITILLLVTSTHILLVASLHLSISVGSRDPPWKNDILQKVIFAQVASVTFSLVKLWILVELGHRVKQSVSHKNYYANVTKVAR